MNNFPHSSSSASAGYISLYVLVFSSVAIIILTGLVVWVDVNVRSVTRDVNRAQAFMISEAGIEYYRWHLAHAQKDYQDGTDQPGPYIHAFNDKDGEPLGTFTLEIIPPPVGSTVVSLTSQGQVTNGANTARLIEAKMAIPSFAKYAAVISQNVRFGEGTTLYGPIHSNSGIRMDGIAHNLVTSSVASYNDPDHSGNNEFGVHTHTAPTDPLPPSAVPNRSDVFMAGRHFPVAPADFIGITSDLANMRSDAIASGTYWGPTTGQGYQIVFKPDDTYDLYRVQTLVAPPTGCSNTNDQDGWGTWSIATKTSLGNKQLPNNGIIFVEDDVWVEGTINTARVTVVSGVFPDNPATRTNITINNDLRYTNYDGSDVIALVAQKHVNVGMISADTIRIDGALMAQNGRVGRYYYNEPTSSYECTRYDRRGRCTQYGWVTIPACGPYHNRQELTSYGMLASNERYGFAYTDGTGYQDRIIIYDANLLYGPPPSFPLTSDFYTVIYWNEAE